MNTLNPLPTSLRISAVIAIMIVIVAVLLSCIHRAIEPKNQSHDQTSNHKTSNNGSNVQVGSNHSLLFGLFDDSK